MVLLTDKKSRSSVLLHSMDTSFPVLKAQSVAVPPNLRECGTCYNLERAPEGDHEYGMGGGTTADVNQIQKKPY